MTNRKLLTVFVSSSLLLAVTGGPARVAAQGPGAGGGDVIAGLRRGGYVIYFRHAATNPEQVDTDTTRLDRCDTQRNLSADGRRAARELGRAFETLRIPVGRVLTSPFCRAVDTAQLAFGRHETSNALCFVMGAEKAQRERQSEELRQMLATPPRPWTNTVIVSHHANLKEAVGLWPKREGDAHVFRPRPGGGFDDIGEVTIDEWSRRAEKAAREFRPDGG